MTAEMLLVSLSLVLGFSFATIPAMVDTFLVAEATTVTAKGDGSAVDISTASHRVFLLQLNITRILEQQALDVSVFGSADGNTWGQKALTAFPQKFYRGEHPLLLDLRQQPEIRFLRAHWDVNRWGRGPETAMFQFQLRLREVPPEMLQEATSGVYSRA
ncbi:MAG TPA: hypothetical protein VF154_01635 [Terriglobales bacterium]|jgi:hypothetical protein